MNLNFEIMIVTIILKALFENSSEVVNGTSFFTHSIWSVVTAFTKKLAINQHAKLQKKS